MALRLVSLTPFWRLIVDHLECPDIGAEYTDYHRGTGVRDPDGGAFRLRPRTRLASLAGAPVPIVPLRPIPGPAVEPDERNRAR
jgi:hypothetical protein